MGTDIHGVFQRHDQATGQWHDVPSKYEQNRHYQLFAVLAGVRNGYGFTGVVAGKPVKPIAAQRGLPADFAMDDDSHPLETLDHMDPCRRKYHEASDALAVWMGDHSHSWLTSSEMLGWAKTAPGVVKVGVLDRATYEAWDKTSTPREYYGMVSGPGVLLINDNEVEKAQTPNWNYIRCRWDGELKAELSYFFDEVARLAAEHGEVRFVFGFDS